MRMRKNIVPKSRLFIAILASIALGKNIWTEDLVSSSLVYVRQFFRSFHYRLSTECHGQVVNTSCFVFGRSQVQILTWRLAILTVDFVVFLSSSEQILGYFLKLGHDHFLDILFNSSFPCHPFILCYRICITDKVSLNKLQ